MHRPRIACTSFFAAALSAAGAAQTFSYPDFSSVAQLNLLGHAVPSGNALRLTANAANQGGWVWRQTQVSVEYGFETTFTFRITPPAFGTKGEGFAFVLHADPIGAATTSGPAWGLGYGSGSSGATGIRNSIAIELDTYQDAFLGDTSANELSIHTRGQTGNNENEQFSIARHTPAINLADGALHTLRVYYLPGTFEVFVDGAPTPAISRAYHFGTGGLYASGAAAPGTSMVNGTAFVGFCATTGAGTLTELVEIHAWNWASTSPTHPCYQGTLGQDVLTVDGAAGGIFRTLRLATWQSFGIQLASPPAFGPGAPYVLFLSLSPQQGVPGTQLGFGQTCFPVLPTSATELVLADTFGLFPALLPALPTPHTIALPTGVITFPLDFTLQAVTFATLNPLALGITNAIDVEFRPSPPPTIQSVSPISAAVGQPVTITGTNFVPGLGLTVNGGPVVPTSSTATSIVFPYPAAVGCSSQLSVINPDGRSVSAPFNPQPVVTGTQLGSGTAAGNQVFVIQGTGFSAGSTVTIGGSAALVLSVSSTSIVVRTPPGTPGPQPVVITSLGGCSAATMYTYL